ncbi:MAG: DUF2281 domain-containing protein [Defluviitaleaceae bacterium]|nr:DUF2281 domain-containing protein [Defluviitaleaceae bacterium]
MQAVKSYRAYYDEGSFVPYEPVTIPKGSQAIITILDFPISSTRKFEPTLTKKRPLSELRGFLKGKVWMADDFNDPLEEMKEYM